MPHAQMDLSALGLDYNDSTMKTEHGVEIDPTIILLPGGQRAPQGIRKKIVADFNRLLFDDVIVVEVEDNFYVVDGANRVGAAVTLGLSTIHARVIHGLTMDQANRLCAALNSQKSKFTAGQSHKALSVGHESVARFIDDTLAKFGLTKAPVSAMRTCVEYDVLQETLDVLAKSGAWEKPKGNGVRFIEGVALVIKDNRLTINLDFLTSILSQASPAILLVRDDGGIPNSSLVRDKLKNIYNDLLGKKKDQFLR